MATQPFEQRLKWFGSVVDGNAVEVGKRSAKYDSYKYDRFGFEGCSLGWRETHEAN
jgi:hypothetical protein